MNKSNLFILFFKSIIKWGDDMNILISMDSFKDSISSNELGIALKKIIQSINPVHTIKVIPIADGGEGTIEALEKLENATKVTLEVTNPRFNKVLATYLIVNDTAIIEMAASSGLTTLNKDQRNPLYTTTYGLGELVKDALDKDIKNFIIGLGGSATNDAGIGFLNALGYTFLDKDNTPLKPIGINLEKIARIDASKAIKVSHEVTFNLACDVSNPFSGLNGAAYIYAKQKGASDEDVLLLEKGMNHYAKFIKKNYQIDLNTIPSTGAAGGLAAAFMPFFNTTIQLGSKLIIDLLNIESNIQSSDLVITGEGKLDHQTFMNKAPLGLIDLAIKHQKKCLVIAGKIIEAHHLLDNPNIILAPLYDQDCIIKPEFLEKEHTINQIKKTIKKIDYLFK